ncbi:MAG: acyl-CoA/acyl-ACP dehydrogenase [Thermaerobacter sp.]|nr:acyl-CoA/acyl-ACP dehydrogenase [Thermaerobacter sp.]
MTGREDIATEERALCDIAHEFAKSRLRAAGAAADAGGAYPWDVVRDAIALGLGAPNVPESFGGAGTGARAQAAMMEELGWGNFGLAASIGASGVVAAAILHAGSTAQKECYLPRLAGADGTGVGALALTEPEGGSEMEILLSQDQTVRTRATKTAGGVRLSGAKRFITNGGQADVTLVLASEGEGGPKTWSLFIVESGDPGAISGRRIPTLGLRGSYTGEIQFEDCILTEDRRLGAPGTGMATVLYALSVARPMASSAALGLARAAYEEAAQYARERRQFGVPIITLQQVGASLAEMRTRLDAARLLVRAAAGELEAGRDASLPAAEAKLFAGETAVQVTQAGLQVLGGYGFTQEFPLEMWVRDAFVARIFFGTAEIQRLEIARGIQEGL